MTRTVGRSLPITVAIAMIVAGVMGSSPAAAAPLRDARVETATTSLADARMETAADPGAGCRAPMPSPVRADYVIADPNCDFGTNVAFRPLLAADGTPVSDVYTGIDEGAAWRVEIPKRWNGDLVLYTHGDHPTNDVVYVESPPGMRESFVAKGYAWAASSYRANHFAIGEAVRDSAAVLDRAATVAGRAPRATYLVGASLGGLVMSVMLEQYPGRFAGAMSVCGMLSGRGFADYSLDYAVTAAAAAGTQLEYPLDPPPGFDASYLALAQETLARLGDGFARYPTTPVLNDRGRSWSASVQRRSGGTRPGFADAFGYWNSVPMTASMFPSLASLPFMLGMYPGVTGGALGSGQGNLAGNRSTFYRLHDGRVTAEETRFNQAALRVDRTLLPRLPDPLTAPRDGAMDNRGRPGVPLLALTGIGDLVIPLALPQQYARRVAANGQSHLLVTRAIRGVEHCVYTPAETERAFTDLVTWSTTRVPPVGDDLLDPRAVADPAFGCRFTDGDHAGWTEPCPSSGRSGLAAGVQGHDIFTRVEG